MITVQALAPSSEDTKLIVVNEVIDPNDSTLQAEISEVLQSYWDDDKTCPIFIIRDDTRVIATIAPLQRNSKTDGTVAVTKFSSTAYTKVYRVWYDIQDERYMGTFVQDTSSPDSLLCLA